MQLELKHIYGYITYGLDAMIQDVICDIEGVDLIWPETIIAERVNYKLSEIKPILRPLSDLFDEENYGLYVDFCDHLDTINCKHLLAAIKYKGSYTIDIQTYPKIEEFMFKNKIDWQYNLIGNGLAIDMNTLIKK